MSRPRPESISFIHCDASWRPRPAGWAGLAVLLAAVTARGETTGFRNVLLLHSYSPTANYTIEQDAAIRRELSAASDCPTYLYLEFMGTFEHPLDQFQEASLLDIYRRRYPPGTLQLIVTTDTPAFQFLVKYGESFAPGVPWVFSAVVPPIDEAAFTGRPITGVVETIDVAGTAELILRLRPQTRRIVVVSTSALASGARLRALAEAQLQPLAGRARVEWWDNLELKTLFARGAALPADAAVLILNYYDVSGRSPARQEAWMAPLAQRASAPVFCLYDTQLRDGAVGGCVTGASHLGRQAGALAVRVLRGEDPRHIPIAKHPGNPVVLNGSALERWHISRANLPPGAEVRLLERPRWRELLPYFAAGAVLVALEAAIIVGLLLSIRGRRSAELDRRRSDERLRALVEHAHDGIALLGAERRLTFCSAAFARVMGRESFELNALDPADLVPPDDAPAYRELIAGAAASSGPHVLRHRMADRPARERWVETVAVNQLANPLLQAIVLNARDVTQQVRLERRLEHERRVLDMIVSDRDLREILHVVVRSIESQIDGMIGSILLVDDEGRRLRHGAAPGLPEEYNAAIDGVVIGPNVGCCGSAAHSGKIVIVRDIETDPRWDAFRPLARKHGLRACWSTPILGADGRVLGTFAMYYHEPRTPTNAEQTLIDHARHLTSLAIERTRSARELRASESLFRSVFDMAGVGIAQVAADGRLLRANQKLCDILGYERAELLRRAFPDITYADDLPVSLDYFNRAKRGEFGSYSIEKRYYHCTGRVVWARLSVTRVAATATVPEYFISVVEDISRSKADAEALQRSEARYRALVENTQDGLILHDGERFLYANPAAAYMLRAPSADAIVGRPVMDIVHPDFRAGVQERIGRLRRGESSATPIISQPLLRFDGTQFESETIGTACDYQGTPAVQIAVRDVTERNAALRAQQELQRRFHAAAESSLDAFYILRAERDARGQISDFRIEYANQNGGALFGREPAALIGQRLGSLIPAPQPAEIIAICARVAESSAPCAAEADVSGWGVQADWLRYQVAPLDDGVALTASNVTASKHIEQELREARDALESRVRDRTAELQRANAELSRSTAEFQAIFNALSDGVMFGTLDERVRLVNPSMCELFGLSADQFAGQAARELFVDPRGRAAPHRGNGGEPQPLDGQRREVHCRRHDGATFLGDCVSRPVRDAAGKPLGSVSIIRDITELRRAEEHVQTLQRELAHAGRLTTLGLMASALAHELNQPLAAIANFARGAARRIASGSSRIDETFVAMQEIARQAERSGEIIRRIRGFVRKGEQVHANVDLNAVVRDAVRLVELEARQRSVALTLELADALPLVLGDSVQIMQSIVNVLRNAIESAQEMSEPRRAVRVDTRAAGRGVEIRVTDLGPGMPPELLQNLFKPFHTNKPDGMGLGLWICQAISESHGGKIAVERTGSEGTTVVLSMPARMVIG
ncbi:MAG: ABC transporter substrate binding protein [Phycisphaerae bacterium]